MKHLEAATQSLGQGTRIPLRNQQLTRCLEEKGGGEIKVGGEVKDGREEGNEKKIGKLKKNRLYPLLNLCMACLLSTSVLPGSSRLMVAYH